METEVTEIFIIIIIFFLAELTELLCKNNGGKKERTHA